MEQEKVWFFSVNQIIAYDWHDQVYALYLY